MFKKSKFVSFIAILLIFASCNTKSNHNSHPDQTHSAHLTAGWYPQEKNLLNQQLKTFLKFGKNNFDTTVSPKTIKALIGPHAGYYYSGICAASVYQNLLENPETLEKNKNINKVIILSPSHTKAFSGIALPDYNTYKTVLGTINVNKNSINLLSKNNNFENIENVHSQEHAIEIQLPFLQKTIEDFTIVPLIIGNIKNEQLNTIAEQLNNIIDDSTLIIISTDLIHYGEQYGYAPFTTDILHSIRFVDSLAIEAITKKYLDKFNLVLEKTAATICGQNAIKILLKLLELDKTSSLEARLCCYYTSAQISEAKQNKIELKDKDFFKNIDDEKLNNSVSYAGILFTTEKRDSLKKQDQLTDYEKKSLLNLTYQTIKNNFETEKVPEHLLWPIKSPGLMQKKGAFVTLNNKDGNLQGCIGRIFSNQTLIETVQDMSKAAAFKDSRFKPLEKEELDDIEIEITVLTPPKKIDDYNEIELGKHGIILKKILPESEIHSAVFLPQVPPSFGWNLQTTLEHLSRKASLQTDAWKEGCTFEVFEGFEIK